ncbi:single-stranded-DNA-specific exonuclease RecJ [Qingshengfaniella alkalisoli]|uniref:Single-stranded-DNA-specific exonuclease RecJ n=1 Tax=Qingshengfaniella alkalisoli TaxID=2599296 RepID=A0A5B8I638_9RHOB|nr:single-stranded-DNA-specific exonuclease RecJ [Qingshengfaniella alkalisoli]QDY68859.1 single-stranded-DNA-specific exonuclease RecJ [Qingshengfaniella alkalisoli]
MAAGGYLGVSKSITGRNWIGPAPAVDRQAEAIAQATGLPRPLCQTLARTGLGPADAEAYLTPNLKDLLPDPRGLKDMDRAAARFLKAVHTRERIAIFADYDVDGGSSAALLMRWLRSVGLPSTLYVPDRIDEGYGPNPPAMRALAENHDLIICVDCGTLSFEALDAVPSGTDVVVLDHHLGGETLPRAVAVVNPNRQDENGELAHLCAASVVFLMLVEANRLLRESGQSGPDLMALLDIVALATVADVAPLIGVNRALVRRGLQVMGRRDHAGLVALSNVARLDQAPSAYHLGYVLGPRINAGGRVGQVDLGARLLATDQPDEARALAMKLDGFNTERREIESLVSQAAIAQAEARGLDAPLVWAAGEGWHPGVVGIVASRLKEATNRPAIVIGLDDGEGKGSGRSVTGIDLGASIHRLAEEGLLIKGGGHKMAAGLTVAQDKLDAAMARLGDLLARQGAGDIGPADLKLDGTLMPGAATPELIAQLERAGPFGASAPAPRFAMPDLFLRHTRRVGDKHLKITAAAEIGPTIDAICFGAFDGPLGDELCRLEKSRVHLAGRLDLNSWGGRQTVQLRLEDAAHAANT